MENLEQYLQSQDEIRREQLDDYIQNHPSTDFRNEADVLRQAIEDVFEPQGYNYLIAYEYPSISKGDAILAKYKTNGTIDIVAVEAKYMNYVTAKWKNQKRKKTKTLRDQIRKVETNAIHYLTNNLHINRNLIGKISRIGVYNDSMGDIQQFHPNDPESDEEGDNIIQSWRSEANNSDDDSFPSQETILQPATQPVTQEGFGWGKAIGTALAIGGALYMASGIFIK